MSARLVLDYFHLLTRNWPGIHTFTVITEAHLGLAQTDGVLALTDAIEFLELCLVDALEGG